MTSRGKWQSAAHLKLIDEHFLALARREIRRLMINMPPRHGKSLLTSQYLPAWWLGTFPDQQVILSTYSDAFAALWGGRVRDIIEEWGPPIWGIQVDNSTHAKNEWKLEDHAGGMVTAGIGGSLTGRGFDLGIVDDPIRNAEIANSPTYQEKMIEWWDSTFATRGEPDNVIVLTMTRWNESDVAGKLLERMADGGEKWTVLRLPALAEENDPLGRPVGKALWPVRWPTKVLEEKRRNMLPSFWAAMYQQRPAPQEGGRFKKQWFLHYRSIANGTVYELHPRDGNTKLVPVAKCRRFATMDLATSLKQEADYTVIAVWDLTPAYELILVDVIRDHVEGPDHLNLVWQAHKRYRFTFIAIEQTAFQLSAVQAARRKGLPVRGFKADTDKANRALSISARYQSGDVYHPMWAVWLPIWETELLTFPNAAHDDCVDTASMAGILVAQMSIDALDHLQRRVAARQAAEQAALATSEDWY